MNRGFCCILAFSVVLASGCTGESGSLPDLPGKAPTLAGSWSETAVESQRGCLIIDETGDLVRIRGLSSDQAPGAPDEIILDGQWRTLTIEGSPEGPSIEFATVGEATLEGSTARIQFSMTVRSLGANIATFTTVIEGTFDGTRIVGTWTGSAISHLPGLPVPPAPEVTNVEFSRGDC